jgi:hypothetical protein
MKDKHKKYHINKTQQLENYNILNTIVPKYLKNYYPYTDFTPEKILFTQKKINILVKKYDKYKSTNNKNAQSTKIKGGDPSHATITFYG